MTKQTNGKTKLSLNKRTIVFLNEQNMRVMDGGTSQQTIIPKSEVVVCQSEPEICTVDTTVVSQYRTQKTRATK